MLVSAELYMPMYILLKFPQCKTARNSPPQEIIKGLIPS
ncbi:Hypothetical protein I595_3608 [Croceitalea dokdonensis DOKDO 023]|uniref:Uncharacterized protein n=1 Tax=Croceitalea dokdonensis DOKDO 023 TaxID=1300341 RepID=A0A0P7AY23_9FLAO|nr:Hypothetical protein I595_3608 [Croceitalea dokdonensis DOKDO 023]